MDDEVVGGFDCKLLRVSGMIPDSIMMGIVHSAMEQAFDKACTKEGVIERLNEKSRFCELAVMQLEWCLKFVHEETNSLIETSCYQSQSQILKLVSDLTETRDHILGRLHETEFALSEKDRDLSQFQQAFNLLQSPKNDGDFCELKNSVDQQFYSIKQKLEDERVNYTTSTTTSTTSDTGGAMMTTTPQELTINTTDLEQEGRENKFYPPVKHFLRNVQRNSGFDKMGSDMDILKETLDVAFGMMSNAISLAEIAPSEQQWRWAIEKDIASLVFRNFLREIQQVINAETKYAPQLLSSTGKNWSQLMDEIGILRNELDQLVILSEDRAKTGLTSRDSVTSPSNKSISKEEWPSSSDISPRQDQNTGNSQGIFSKADDQNHPEDPLERTSSAGQGSLVAEMIRNHESIIKQKSEELNWLKGEILRERGSLAVKKDKGQDTMRKRIQGLISRLDNVINGNVKLGSYYGSVGGVSVHEVRQLNEEQEDSNVKIGIMDDIYLIVLKDSLKRVFANTHDDDAMRTVAEDVFKLLFREFAKESEHKMSSYNIESHIRDEMYYFVCSEAFKDAHDGFSLEECSVGRNQDNLEDLPSSSQYQNFENLVKEDVQSIVLREMVQEWRYFLERFKIENCIREEVSHIASDNAANNTHVSTPTALQTAKVDGELQDGLSFSHTEIEKVECLVQGDLYLTFFKNMVKDWKKEIESYSIELLARKQEESQTLLSSDSTLRCGLNDNMMQTVESLSNYVDREENLILSASLSLVKRNACIEHSYLEREKLVDQNIHHKGMVITNDEDSFGSVINNLEKVLQYIIMSKEELNKLRSCLGLAVGYSNRGHNMMTYSEATVEDNEISHYLLQNEKEVKSNTASYVLSTFTNFSKAMVDFEFMVHKKIGLSVSRLEELKHLSDFYAEHINSIRKREFLYKKAFVRRCSNLQKAEAEVDLLADQLDDTLILLEKIYLALDHYSPVLQHYSGIRDILKLTEKELKRLAARTIVQ